MEALAGEMVEGAHASLSFNVWNFTYNFLGTMLVKHDQRSDSSCFVLFFH